MEELNELDSVVQEEKQPLALITAAEIDAQVTTAKNFPRTISRCESRAVELCTFDVDTAQSCIYTVPRAGKKLTGPSIRFAESIAAAWGNMRIAARVLGNNDKVVTVEAVAHDLESNVAFKVEKQRRITTKEGKTFNDDMVVVTGNAAVSVAMRDAILRVVPKSFQKKVYDQVRRVAIGEKGSKPFAKRRDDAMAYFKSLGIAPERVLAAVERPKLEDIDTDDLELLIGLATAIKNGDKMPDEAFPVPENPEKEMNVGKKATVVVKEAPVNTDLEDIDRVRKLLTRSNIAEADLMAYGRDKGIWKVKSSLDEFPFGAPGKLAWIIANWESIETEIQKPLPL